MNQSLHFTNSKPGPITVTLVDSKPTPYEEIVERRHGTFRITIDDAGRWLLFERRSIAGRPLYSNEWVKVVTVERDRQNPMFYSILNADTNERTMRQARFAKQVITDILDFQEREFMELLYGV